MKRVANNADGLTGWLDKIETSISSLDPLASTMSKALLQVGIKPPSELSALSKSFHENIVAPVSQSVTNQSIGTSIVNFFKQTMNDKLNGKKLSAPLNTVANGGNAALSRLQAEKFFTDLFANPFVLVGILAIIGGIIYIATRKNA